MPKRAASVVLASASVSMTAMASARWPRAMRPPRSARAMLPPPMIVMFIVLSPLTRTEERGADAHHRRALGDGRLEVAGHAHRQRVERQAFRAGSREKIAQEAELLSLARHVVRFLGDAHEAA